MSKFDSEARAVGQMQKAVRVSERLDSHLLGHQQGSEKLAAQLAPGAAQTKCSDAGVPMGDLIDVAPCDGIPAATPIAAICTPARRPPHLVVLTARMSAARSRAMRVASDGVRSDSSAMTGIGRTSISASASISRPATLLDHLDARRPRCRAPR